ncbi:hypothetical protein F5883DRAFT_620671 [Diaporthe sp. PMI_573]|nr:hypothetical protein F5883DRAFT_620671 [Diaporthaceae sp. PMI_573]
MTVHGFGICDPNKYAWKDVGVLPSWLDISERNNAMGFLRMSTRFNMNPPAQGDGSKVPPSGDYPFYVLLYWPRVETFLRETRWGRAIKRGGFLQTEGRVVHFIGKMIGLLKTSLLRDVPSGVYIPVIVPTDLNRDGPSGSGIGGSPFRDMKTRTTPKKNTRNTEGDVAGGAKQGPSPSVSSPSAARASRVQEGSSSAQKPRKRRLDPSFGTELGASSSGSKAVGQAGNPTLTDVADPDAALQSSIAGDGRSGGEGSPDHFYEAPLPSQSHGIADGTEGNSSGITGGAGGEDAIQPTGEPETRSQKRARRGKEPVSERSSGRKRTGARR